MTDVCPFQNLAERCTSSLQGCLPKTVFRPQILLQKYWQFHAPPIKPFIHNVMFMFSFSSAILPVLLQLFSKPVRNFHERNNSNHYYYHLHQAEVSPGHRMGGQPIKHLFQHLILMQVTIGSLLVPSGRKEDNAALQLVPWFS